MKRALETHAEFCDCTPIKSHRETGEVFLCGNDGVLIWGPTVDVSRLGPPQQIVLMVLTPMRYDDDGDGANDMLLRLGYGTVTPGNFSEALLALREGYEALLW